MLKMSTIHANTCIQTTIRQCSVADGFGGSVQSWCYAAALLGTRGVNGDNYRNTVLLSMLLPDIRSVFGDTTFFSKMGHRHIVHVTLSPCCRERRQSLSLQRCGHLIRRWTTASGVYFKRGSTARGSMM